MCRYTVLISDVHTTSLVWMELSRVAKSVKKEKHVIKDGRPELKVCA